MFCAEKQAQPCMGRRNPPYAENLGLDEET